jgi:hypothetical protein
MPITYPITLPQDENIASLRLTARTSVAVSASPFTGQQQVQEHAGQWWEMEMEIPPMLRSDAERWVAFLLKLNGQAGTFLAGDIVGRSPRGTMTGTPLVNGAVAARAKTIALDGITAGQTLLEGDYIQVGSGALTRLHKNLTDVTANGSGQVTLDLWPAVREPIADNAPVTLTNCKGTFRLASNQMGWEIGAATFYGLNIAAREAI